jgi:hypothetical protein
VFVPLLLVMRPSASRTRSTRWRGRQLAGVALGLFTDQFAGETARSLGIDVFNITPADVQTDIGGFLRATQVEFGKCIESQTFLQAHTRLDPASLGRLDPQYQHRFGGDRGYSLSATVATRYLLNQPSRRKWSLRRACLDCS